MILPHTILGLLNTFSVEKLKKFKEFLHAEYGATWNTAFQILEVRLPIKLLIS